MSSSIDYRPTVPVRSSVDVLVAGGGPAGLGAAIASARHGAKTLLVERYGFLGGNMTASLVGPCMTSYSLDGKQQLIKGIFEEMVLRLEALGGAVHPSKVPAGGAYTSYLTDGLDKTTPFDPEALKSVAAEMCLEAGVELLLHSFIVDALVENRTVGGAIFASKSGLEAIRAKVVIDCTADADIVARAGGAFEYGRESDGLTQPMTMFFRIGNVDDLRVDQYCKANTDDFRMFEKLVKAAQEAGEFTLPRNGIGMYLTMQPGVWRVNTTRVLRRDGTNVGDLTLAEVEGRRQVDELMRFFRKWVPGFENCVLLDTATQIGVRETRRIVGAYTVTLEDLAQAREFEDVVVMGGYPVDIHGPNDAKEGFDHNYRTANAYEIPFRALVPRDLEQILVAGRSLSSTHEALAAIRIMPSAMAMGQAAGTAAALSLERGLRVRECPIDALQDALVRDGAHLGPRFEAVAAR
jgi:hypothetical protein